MHNAALLVLENVALAAHALQSRLVDAVAACATKKPGAHTAAGVHAVAPGSAANDTPAMHGVHAAAARPAANEPGAHSVHEPFDDWNDPGEHAVHVVPLPT